jgi:hypothetical protein
MMDFMSRLKEGIFNSFEMDSYLPPSLKILKHRKAMKDALQESRLTGKVVGVYSPVLGNGMFLVCVEQILLEPKNAEKIILKPFDMNGIMLATNELLLHDIKSVCPFDTFYVNPMTLNIKTSI